MNGKGCAGSIASGVSSGKMLWRKWSSIQLRSALVTSWPSTSTMPALGQDAAQIAPDRLLVGGKLRNRLVDGDELLGRRQAVGAAFGDAFADLRLDTGDADHEELIKVIGGNRQEPDPLQRGMAGIDRFLEHPAIEMQPGQLAVDESLGAGGDRRRRFGIGVLFLLFQ